MNSNEDAIERLRLTQNELNKQGASDLVVELFISHSSINILEESIHLAIALLEGGNTEVQKSIFRRLNECEIASEKFFQVFYDKMYTAQKILKSMSSITNDTHIENDDYDDGVFTSRLDLISPNISSTTNDNRSSAIPTTEEKTTLNSSANSSLKLQQNVHSNINEMEPLQALEARTTTHQTPSQSEPKRNSIHEIMDVLDF
ncbi:unnamed protein product, partial [Rotaria socialis]